jgi:hypothetical protein
VEARAEFLPCMVAERLLWCVSSHFFSFPPRPSVNSQKSATSLKAEQGSLQGKIVLEKVHPSSRNSFRYGAGVLFRRNNRKDGIEFLSFYVRFGLTKRNRHYFIRSHLRVLQIYLKKVKIILVERIKEINLPLSHCNLMRAV